MREIIGTPSEIASSYVHNEQDMSADLREFIAYMEALPVEKDGTRKVVFPLGYAFIVDIALQAVIECATEKGDAPEGMVEMARYLSRQLQSTALLAAITEQTAFGAIMSPANYKALLTFIKGVADVDSLIQ